MLDSSAVQYVNSLHPVFSRQLMRAIETEDSIDSLSRLTTTLLTDTLQPSSLSPIGHHQHPLEAQQELNHLLFASNSRPTDLPPEEAISRPSYESLMERIQQTLNA